MENHQKKELGFERFIFFSDAIVGIAITLLALDLKLNVPETLKRMQLMFNLDMLNGLVAVIVCLFHPVAAFMLLFFKIPLFIFASFYIAAQHRKAQHGNTPKKFGRK
jgi:uncharacterized membrane protein